MSQKFVDPSGLNENVIKTKQHVEAVRSALDSAKQNVMQFTTLPVPDATWNGKVVQYTGTTTSSLTKGYFYSCEVVPDTDPTEYRWIRQDVMKPIDADGTTVAYDQVTGELSAIPATNSSKGIVQHGDGTEIGNDGQVNVVDRLVVTATLPTADDTLVGAVRLYVGATGTYELGGIYQCQETSTDVYEWVLISMADVDLSAYQKTFLGTTAEWNAKTTAQKIEFDEADLSDDLGGGMVVSNAITLGDHNPIDSDAVARIVPSGASASNQLVTADETHDLQLFINGATYATTTDFINKLASEINAIKPNTSRTYGGTISGEWTGKTYFIGTYTVNNTGAGIAQIKCENAQSGKDVCVFTMSGGSPAVVSWQKLVTDSDLTSSVTSGSNAPVTSGGVYSHLTGTPTIGIDTVTLGRLGFGSQSDNAIKIAMTNCSDVDGKPCGSSGACMYIQLGLVEFAIGPISADPSQWSPNNTNCYIRYRYGSVWQAWRAMI